MLDRHSRERLVQDPTDFSRLFDAVTASFGSIDRRTALRYGGWLRCFGSTGLAGARHIDRHYESLTRANQFVVDTLGIPGSVRLLDFGGLRVRYADDDFASRTFFAKLFSDGAIHEAGVVKYLSRVVGPNDVFIDVGAHTGYFSCIAAARGAVVFAIELQQAIVPIIRRNALINDFKHLHVISAAAGARDGLTSILRYEPTLSGRAFGESDSGGSATLDSAVLDWVPVVRLDTLTADLPKPPVLVKIDGEGSELAILKGAQTLIARRETRFILEFHVSLVAEFGGCRENLYPLFPLDRWSVYEVLDRGLRRLDSESLHALLDPVGKRKTNPNLLFEPLPQSG